MSKDRDCIIETAAKLKELCKMRWRIYDDTGELDCYDCPFCDRYPYGIVCRLTDDCEYLPKDWEIE